MKKIQRNLCIQGFFAATDKQKSHLRGNNMVLWYINIHKQKCGKRRATEARLGKVCTLESQRRVGRIYAHLKADRCRKNADATYPAPFCQNLWVVFIGQSKI